MKRTDNLSVRFIFIILTLNKLQFYFPKAVEVAIGIDGDWLGGISAANKVARLTFAIQNFFVIIAGIDGFAFGSGIGKFCFRLHAWL